MKVISFVSYKKVKCKECGQIKIQHAKGLCENCYQRLYRRKRNPKNSKKFDRYTKEEDKILMNMVFEGRTNKEIGKRLGRTKGSVRWRIQYLKSKGVIFPTTNERTSKIYENKTNEGRYYNFGKELPKEHRDNIRKSLKGKFVGEDNPSWKGGVSLEHKKYYNAEYEYNCKELKKKIKYCELCGITRKECFERRKKGERIYLECAHLIHSTPEFQDHSEENFIILCSQCHQNLDKY